MDDIFQIDILGKDGHDDLKFRVKDLTPDLTFDTYYFGIAIEPYEGHSDIKKCVASFLGHWVRQAESMTDGQTRYFPIDISDQYTGCLRVDLQGENFSIKYGWSKKEGWSVNINDPTAYFESVSDFRSDIPETLNISKEEFLSSLRRQIDRLAN